LRRRRMLLLTQLMLKMIQMAKATVVTREILIMSQTKSKRRVPFKSRRAPDLDIQIQNRWRSKSKVSLRTSP
jgi:hypothetical protein